jgi:hypothetical protein
MVTQSKYEQLRLIVVEQRLNLQQELLVLNADLLDCV